VVICCFSVGAGGGVLQADSRDSPTKAVITKMGDVKVLFIFFFPI